MNRPSKSWAVAAALAAATSLPAVSLSAVAEAADRPPLPTEPPTGTPVDRHVEELPADFEPVVWADPPPRPALDGPLAPNELLTGATIHGEDLLERPEDIAPGLDGNLYAGTHDGTLWRISVDVSVVPAAIGEIEAVANLGAGVLGLDAYDEHTMIAAVIGQGIVAVDTSTGETTVLTNQIDGDLIYFPDGVAVAADGTIYFTEASTRYHPGFPNDFLDGRPHGRVLRYEPSTQVTTVVADGIHFANGIVVAPDESHLLVAESFRFRLLRVGLDDGVGTVEPFGADLINGPDNIRLDSEGRIWVGGSNLRSEVTDAASTNAEVRRQLAALTPEEQAAAVAPYGFAQVLDPEGQPIFSFHDATGRFYSVSSVLPFGDIVLFGTVRDTGVAVLPMPAELAGDGGA